MSLARAYRRPRAWALWQCVAQQQQPRLQSLPPRTPQAGASNTSQYAARRWNSELSGQLDGLEGHHIQDHASIKFTGPSKTRNAKTPRTRKDLAERPVDQLNLEEMTRLLAPIGGDPVDDVQSALDSQRTADASDNRQRITMQHLTGMLERKHADITTWLAFRNAIVSDSWPRIRDHLRQANVPDSRWPAFVLQHALCQVSTLSELSDGLAVFLARLPSMQFNRARVCFDMIAEMALYHLPGIHFIPRLMDVFLSMVNPDPEKGPDHAHRIARERMASKMACLLIRHPDERARDAAFRLLDWADQQGERLQQHLCGIFLGYNRVRPVAATTREPIQPRRVPVKSKTFLTIPVVERILQSVNPDHKGDAVRAAVLCAGRHRDINRAREWYDELDVHGRWDLYAYMVAMSQLGQASHEAWSTFSRIQDVLESSNQHDEDRLGTPLWEAFLSLLARDKKVPVSRVFAILAIRTEADQRDLVEASMELAQRFCLDAKSYTIIMNGLLLRGEVDAALDIWRAMLQRGVRPDLATLSVLARCLFARNQPRAALGQVRLWCRDGVLMPSATQTVTEPLVIPDSSNDLEALAPPSPPASVETETVTLAPDVMLGTVLLEGLYDTNSAPAAYTLWTMFHETLGLSADEHILSVILKCATTLGVPPRDEARAIFARLLLDQHAAELGECSAADALGWAKLWIGRMRSRSTEPDLKLPPCAVTFTPVLFDQYVRLCLQAVQCKPHERLEHVVLALVWMRALNLTPLRGTVAAVCLEVNDQMPPLSTINFRRRDTDTDDDPETQKRRENAGVLAKWLPQSQWPRDEEMRRAWNKRKEYLM